MDYGQVSTSTSTPTWYGSAPSTQREESERVQQRLDELENTLRQYISQREVIK